MTLPFDVLSVEINVPAEDAFVLGRTALPAALTLNASTGMTTVDVREQITSLTVTPGRQAPQGAPDVGTASMTVLDALNPADYPTLHPGVPFVVRAGDDAIFTGEISDVTARTDKGDTRTFTSITAVDAIRDLAGITRSGVRGDGYQSLFERVTSLSTSSALIDLPADDDTDRFEAYVSDFTAGADGWERFGNLPTIDGYEPIPEYLGPFPSLIGPDPNLDPPGPTLLAQTGYQTPVQAGESVNFVAGSGGLQRRIDGLQPGREYVVRVTAQFYRTDTELDTDWLSYAVGVNGVWGTPVTLAGDSTRDLYTAFIADSDSATIQIARQFTGTLTRTTSWALEMLLITEAVVGTVTTADSAALRDVVYESSLVSHLQMAHDSTGRAWYINHAGRAVTGVQLTATAATDTLTDDAPLSAGVYPYVDIDIAYDTAEVVNELQVTNHGLRLRDDPTAGPVEEADDTTIVYVNQDSADYYGPRSSTIDLCVTPAMLPRRAAAILRDSADAAVTVKSVTLDMLACGVEPALWEVGHPVTVRRLGSEALYVLVGTAHTVTPTKWLTTLYLRKAQ